MGILGLVLGIVGLLGSLVGVIWPIGNVPTIVGLVLAVAGIVFSVLDIKKSEKHGKGIAGLVLSIIAVVLGCIMLIACGGTKSAITANDAGSTTFELPAGASVEDFNLSMDDADQESIAAELESVVNDAVADIEIVPETEAAK